MPIATTNPATGEVIQTFQPLSPAQIDRKLQLSVTAFQAGQKTPFAERASRMLKAADILDRDKDKFAHALVEKLVTYATGAPPEAADRAQIDAIVEKCRAKNYGLRSLVRAIVESDLFRTK